LQILSLMDDMTAKKMTSFSVRELQRLYGHFGLREFVMAHNETDLLIGTDKWENGREFCYCIHPEELFLYVLTKCKTRMMSEKVVDMILGGIMLDGVMATVG
jgi:hypothetical protein